MYSIGGGGRTPTVYAEGGGDCGPGGVCGVDGACGPAGQLCTVDGDVVGEEASFAYAGPGGGLYEKVEQFKYVGPGGNFDKELISLRERRFNWWCLLIPCLLLIIAVVLIIMFMIPPEEGTTTTIEQEIIFDPLPVTTSLPFDCEAGYWNWEKGWSNPKKRFCCDYSGRGCPVVTTSSLPFDCDAGFSNWQNGWSRDKKSWCCMHYSRGCQQVTLKTSQPYNCQAGLDNWAFGWSAGKKLWCCAQFSLGCPTTLPYDCDAGFSNWQTGWSDSKKHWCCNHANRGCHVTTSLPYDCDAGYDNWKAGWSIGKKDWCCAYINRGCAPITTSLPYDCDAGYANWKAGWATSKKHWCCQYANRGCIVSEPYDCDAGYANWNEAWSEAKKHWCCLHHEKGCFLATTMAPPSSCQLWGDPHVKSFDHTQYVFYREGDFWIVKSDPISIQGRFQATSWTKENDKTDYSSITKVIMSGSLIGGSNIEITPTENNGQILCDGKAILHDFGEATCGAAHLKYGGDGSLIDSAMSALPHKIVHVTYPNGIIIQINRWPNFCNVMVTMRPIPGQDGVCGNFNNDKSDDTGKLVHQRFGNGIPPSELLFSAPIPLNLPTIDLPLKKCVSLAKKEAARDQCRGEDHGWWALSECMSDVCAGDHPFSQPQVYDCQAGSANWKAGWSQGKKSFCCAATNGQYGCGA